MKAKNSSFFIDTDRQISGLRPPFLASETVLDSGTQLITTNPGMRAAESQNRVRAQFQELSPKATDNRIANAKSLNKRSGHRL